MNIVPEIRARHVRSSSRRGGRRARGLLARGVVTAVYEPDNGNRRVKLVVPGGLVCDVHVYSPIKTIFREVPIMVSSGGLVDHEVWRPRAATLDLQQSVLQMTDAPGAASQAHNIDGDHVIVAFLDDDLQRPIIVGQLPHPGNQRKPSIADVKKYVYRRWLRGNSVGVTTTGNLEVDASLANSGEVVPPGNEVPDPLAGDIRLTLKEARTVSVQNAVASTPEAMLRADTFLQDLETALDNIQVVVAAVAAAVPFTIAPGSWAGVEALKAQISTSLTAAKLPYRAKHLESD